MPHRPLLFFLFSLSILSYVSSDIYLPAFPAILTEFSTSKSMVEYTLSFFLLGLAVGQFLFAPLSDTIGRKKVLVLGLLLYALASVFCAWSPSIYILCFARFLQALGVSAAAGLWQTIIVDTYPAGKSRDHVFSIIIPLIALSPVFAPILGGYLTAHIGWQAVFHLLAGVGGILLFITLFIFRESLPNSARHPLHWKHWVHRSLILFRSRFFIGYIGGIVFAAGAFFVFITEIPFVLKATGETAQTMGYMFIPQTITFLLGGFYSKTIPADKKHIMMIRITWLAIAGSLLLLVMSCLPQINAWQYILPFSITAFVNGAIYPLGYALIYEHHGDMPGMVAGLAGCLMAFVGFLASALMGSLSAYGVVAMAILILLSYLISLRLVYLP